MSYYSSANYCYNYNAVANNKYITKGTNVMIIYLANNLKNLRRLHNI